ncbi:hypothetical protein LguiB_010746 [Lonicera macranthoides]
MDPLSTSFTSLNIPPIQSCTTTTSRELYHFKFHNPLHNFPPNPQLSSFKKPTSKISNNRPTTLTHKNSIPSPVIPASQTQTLKHPPTVHRNAATGYAAALIDAASCKNMLGSVERDVKRLLKLMRNKQLRAFFKEDEVLVKEVLEKGRFERHLVVLVRMLVKRNKLGMVKGVLDEFHRIYEELSSGHYLVYDC